MKKWVIEFFQNLTICDVDRTCVKAESNIVKWNLKTSVAKLKAAAKLRIAQTFSI